MSLKVLMIVSWYTPINEPLKTGVFHYEMALGLKKYCNIETMIWWPFDTTLQEEKNVEVTPDGITIIRSQNKPIYSRFAFCNKVFKEIKKEFMPDIIHAHCANQAGLLGYYISRKNGVKYCVTEHCPPEMLFLNNAIWKIALKKVYKNSVCNIAVSTYLKNALNRLMGANSFICIFNGVEITEYGKGGALYENGAVNALIVAQFYDEKIKGFQYLIPAIAQYNSENSKKVFLHICGDGEYKDLYERLAKELKIDNYIKFYGSCSKEMIYELIETVDFCISSSLYESAGVFIEESMVLGKPLLVTKSGGGDSLVNKQTAIVVEAGDTQALKNGIKSMVKRYTLFDTQLIKEYANKMFSMESVCAEQSRIYEKYKQ